MTQPIFDPSAPLESQLADSVSKGFLSASDADALAATDAWLGAHWDALVDEFPGLAVTVLPDESLDTGFATYVGPTSYESESKARQFSPGVPYVTLEPRDPFGAPIAMEDVAEDLIDWARSGVKRFRRVADRLPWLLEGEEKKGDDFATELKKLIEDLEKLRKDEKLSDGDLVKILPPVLTGTAGWVGGLIADSAGHENLKLWHVDSGASVSCISKDNFERLQKKGATPKQEGEVEIKTADGVKKYPKYSGIPMSFGRKTADGKPELAKCDVPIIVLQSDLLGLDQLKKTGTKLILDPAGGTIELVARA